ncbi:MAG: response regulator [bacterium]
MLSVLSVDDESDVRQLISDFVSKEGHKFRGAKSGEEAIRMIEEEKPDLVFLDYNMPGMDGEAALRKMIENHPDLFVVMVTINTNKPKAMELMVKGASDYITKPIDFPYLSRILSLREIMIEKRQSTC